MGIECKSMDLTIENQQLNQRDALGISNVNQFEIVAQQESQLLFIEVPMKF